VINYIRTTSIELNPDLREINIGKLPVSPKFDHIWNNFKKLTLTETSSSPSGITHTDIVRCADWNFVQKQYASRGDDADILARINQVLLTGFMIRMIHDNSFEMTDVQAALPVLREESYSNSPLLGNNAGTSGQGSSEGIELLDMMDRSYKKVPGIPPSSVLMSKKEGKKKASSSSSSTLEMEQVPQFTEIQRASQSEGGSSTQHSLLGAGGSFSSQSSDQTRQIRIGMKHETTFDVIYKLKYRKSHELRTAYK